MVAPMTAMPPDAGRSAPGSNLPEFSVSELAQALKRTVEDAYGYVRVRGEVSSSKRHSSGHLYMRLKDDQAVLEAVCWRGSVARLRIHPDDGMEVVASGRLTTYPGRSQYQLVIESLELAGEGALLKLLEERKRRLAAEGLFAADRKRRLPYLPSVIGVITSPTGAVIRDILHRLADRFPSHVLVWPVAVQGELAAGQVVAAIEGFNALASNAAVPRPDVLIVARGGGSLEDLMTFNEEAVVRAAVASAIPLISAIGHETDTSLLDLAADLRAPTPTAAAEMAVPVRSELTAQLLDLTRRQVGALGRMIEERRVRVDGMTRGLGDPHKLLETVFQRLDDRTERLHRAVLSVVVARRSQIVELAARLSHPRDRLAAAGNRLTAEMRALGQALRHRVTGLADRCGQITERLSAVGLLRSLAEVGGRTGQAGDRLDRLVRQDLTVRAGTLQSLGQRLDSLSYKGVLQRGYVVVRSADGQPVTAAADTKSGQAVTLEWHDGRAEAWVGSETDAAPPPVSRRRGVKPAKDQGTLF